MILHSKFYIIICIFAGAHFKGLTGFDSRSSWNVSMPGVVNIARKINSHAIITGNDYNYAIAA